jgi:NAD+ synthase
MKEIDRIVAFLSKQFHEAGKDAAVVAVSGGIDSALSLSLTVRALGADHVVPILLPYAKQDMSDAETICTWNSIPRDQWIVRNIQNTADEAMKDLRIPESEHVRRGNVMARTRMIYVFDAAKALDALVVGTENKSEHFLGYFTRFGDAASDIEPISHLTKTKVRAMARELGIPQQILNKEPSAGLWQGQTDETELGFSYEEADKVIEALGKKNSLPKSLNATSMDNTTAKKIILQIQSQQFKHQVPYKI